MTDLTKDPGRCTRLWCDGYHSSPDTAHYAVVADITSDATEVSIALAEFDSGPNVTVALYLGPDNGLNLTLRPAEALKLAEVLAAMNAHVIAIAQALAAGAVALDPALSAEAVATNG